MNIRAWLWKLAPLAIVALPFIVADARAGPAEEEPAVAGPRGCQTSLSRPMANELARGYWRRDGPVGPVSAPNEEPTLARLAGDTSSQDRAGIGAEVKAASVLAHGHC